MSSHRLNQLFIKYGLTKNQAKIFSNLIQNEHALSAKQLSLLTNVARESIYNILIDLKEKGLIEHTISKPKRYKAIPLKTALTHLYEQKSKQIHEIEKLTTQVLLDHDKTARINQIEEKSQFVFIPKNKQLVNRISNAISHSKKILRIITSWKRHMKALTVYEIALKTALFNGVEIQVLVTEKSENDKIPKNLRFFYTHPNTSIKFVSYPATLIEAIIDDEEVFLMTDPQADLTESPALWSNNKSLITALKTCFYAACDKS